MYIRLSYLNAQRLANQFQPMGRGLTFGRVKFLIDRNDKFVRDTQRVLKKAENSCVFVRILQ